MISTETVPYPEAETQEEFEARIAEITQNHKDNLIEEVKRRQSITPEQLAEMPADYVHGTEENYIKNREKYAKDDVDRQLSKGLRPANYHPTNWISVTFAEAGAPGQLGEGFKMSITKSFVNDTGGVEYWALHPNDDAENFFIDAVLNHADITKFSIRAAKKHVKETLGIFINRAGNTIARRSRQGAGNMLIHGANLSLELQLIDNFHTKVIKSHLPDKYLILYYLNELHPENGPAQCLKFTKDNQVVDQYLMLHQNWKDYVQVLEIVE